MKNAPKAEVPPAPKSTCPVCGAPFEGYHYCNIKPAPPTPVQDFGPGSAYQIEGEENGRRLLSSAPPASVSEPYEAAFNVLEPALGLSCEDPACDLARDHKPPHRLRKSAPVSEPSQPNSEPLSEALMIAAQCWCDPETSDRVMDPVLATAFAKRLAPYLALKAQNATLTAEISDLKHGIPLTYNPNAMCRTGHEMVLFKNGDGQSPLLRCPMCDITAEVEARKRGMRALEDARPLCPDCRDKQGGEPCLGCTIQTQAKELERLRDLIVLVNCREEYYRGERACFLHCDELVPLHSEARAIRAAREAGKS